MRREVLDGFTERVTAILEIAELVEALVSRGEQHHVAVAREPGGSADRILEGGDNGGGGKTPARERLVELARARSIEHRVARSSCDLVGEWLDRRAGALAAAGPHGRPPREGAQRR